MRANTCALPRVAKEIQRRPTITTQQHAPWLNRQTRSEAIVVKLEAPLDNKQQPR